MTATTVEWLIETLDGPDSDEAEILDVDHAETYAEALTRGGGVNVRIGLVRDTDKGYRGWAYPKDGRLPESFTDAYGDIVAKVPARYQREIDKAAGQ